MTTCTLLGDVGVDGTVLGFYWSPLRLVVCCVCVCVCVCVCGVCVCVCVCVLCVCVC